MESKENVLGTEKIGNLIRKFSIPCIISLLVNSLYNMVDQIFIGWKVGPLGNGATNVVFPLVLICLAFALMIGDGTSAFFSLKLGQKNKKEAAKGIANGLMIGLVFSLLICTISLLFLPQLLNLFGSTDALRNLALDYGYIIVLGIPFMVVGTCMNAMIRADGSPKYSMISMVSGAVLNTILDPVFLWGFDMGVKGAALATIISQFLTFILNICYIKRFKSIEIKKDLFKPNFRLIGKLLILGASSFLTQISFALVFSVENIMLGKYGAMSKYGSEIPIAVFGIVMKINQILNSIIIGIAVGSQPIVGYNYGAQNYDRVKDTIKTVLKLSFGVGIVAFILFQTIPDKLISIFGSGNADYMEFACLSFRIFLMFCMFNAIQIASSVFFQGIGKSGKSAILSLSRQVILLIPAIIILSKIFGLMGILYAGPVADGIAVIIATSLLASELKNLTKKHEEVSVKTEERKLVSTLDRKIVITIAREYGSGGRYVGKLVANKLGIPIYDKELIRKVAKETGLSEDYIRKNEEKSDIISNISNENYYLLKNDDEIFIKESEIIKDLAQKESCVIVGRCSNIILKDFKDVIHIFIYSDLENKISRVTKYYGIEGFKAEKEIKNIDKLRSNYYKHYTDKDWNDKETYDLMINSDKLGIENAVDFICEYVKNIK